MCCSYQTIDLIIKAVAFLATAVGVIIAAFTFRNNSKTLERNSLLEKAKWLNQLHEKFFEKENYIQIRMALDYNSTPNKDYVNLKTAVEKKSDDHEDLQEKFVNYLNFFEYVATLGKTGQLDPKEINMLFGYYLKNIGKHDWVMTFASKNEFKNLPGLINNIATL